MYGKGLFHGQKWWENDVNNSKLTQIVIQTKTLQKSPQKTFFSRLWGPFIIFFKDIITVLDVSEKNNKLP